MQTKINYKIYRGDTTPLEKFRLKDANGEILILTENDKIYFTLKEDGSDTALVKKNLQNGITKDADNYYHITLETGDTEELDVEKTYVYDIECDLLIGGKVFVNTPISGKIALTKDVTGKGDKS